MLKFLPSHLPSFLLQNPRRKFLLAANLMLFVLLMSELMTNSAGLIRIPQQTETVTSQIEPPSITTRPPDIETSAITFEQIFGAPASIETSPSTESPSSPMPVEAQMPMQAAARPNLTLIGIYVNGYRPSPTSTSAQRPFGIAVFINNDSNEMLQAKVGDQIGEWSLSEISVRSVQLAHGKESLTFTFPADEPPSFGKAPGIGVSDPLPPPQVGN